MAHLALFKKFDEMKIGDVFTFPTANYKDYNSAKGTINKAASEYRRERNADFYVTTVHSRENFVRVQRVFKMKESIADIAFRDVPAEREKTKKVSFTPHNSEVYISSLIGHLTSQLMTL